MLILGGGAPMQALAPGRWRPSVRHCHPINQSINHQSYTQPHRRPSAAQAQPPDFSVREGGGGRRGRAVERSINIPLTAPYI